MFTSSYLGRASNKLKRIYKKIEKKFQLYILHGNEAQVTKNDFIDNTRLLSHQENGQIESASGARVKVTSNDESKTIDDLPEKEKKEKKTKVKIPKGSRVTTIVLKSGKIIERVYITEKCEKISVKCFEDL